MIDSFLSKEQGYQSEIAILKGGFVLFRTGCLVVKVKKELLMTASSPCLSLLKKFLHRLPYLKRFMRYQSGHKRKKGGRQAIPENLPRIEVIHDLVMPKNSASVVPEICIGQESSGSLI